MLYDGNIFGEPPGVIRTSVYEAHVWHTCASHVHSTHVHGTLSSRPLCETHMCVKYLYFPCSHMCICAQVRHRVQLRGLPHSLPRCARGLLRRNRQFPSLQHRRRQLQSVQAYGHPRRHRRRPQSSYWSTSDSLDDKGNYSYFSRTISADSAVAKAEAEFVKFQGHTKSGIAHVNDPYGSSWEEAFVMYCR